MAEKICFTLPFLVLCIALFLCQGLGLSTGKDNDESKSFLKANVEAEYNKMSQTAWWFSWSFSQPPPSGGFPKFPWPFVHPPLPSGGFPKFPWPFVHPPLPSGGFPKFPWPFVHPPLPSGGFPKFPWPFVHPPLPSGGFPKFPWPHPPLPSGGFPKFPWPFVHPPLPSGGFPFPWHPWIPPYIWHPHGATENANINNEGVPSVTEEIRTTSTTNPKCSSTSQVVESCMQASSMSHSWGYTFTPHCCKAIKEVSDECHPTIVPMIKDQCLNKATAPPPTA